MKGDDSLTSGHQEMDNWNAHVAMDETHAREIVIEEATEESRAIADAGVPSLPCSTSFKVQSPAECLSSKLNVAIGDDKLDTPKEGSFGMVEVQVEQSLVLNGSSADAKEMETADDQLLQADKEEVEGLQAADRTKKQEVEADDRRRGSEIEADEKANTDEETELDAEEKEKKHEFNSDSGVEDQKREAYEKVEKQQGERCSSEKSTEKGSTSGYETTSFKEELITIKENECPTEDSDSTEASTDLKKKKRKKSEHLFELKASPATKEESEKAKKLDKHSDHMFCADFEPLVSGTTEEKGKEALIGPLEYISSSDYYIVASKQNELDMKEAERESLLTDMASEKETLKKKKKARLADEKTDHLVQSYDAEKGGEMEQDVGGGEDGIGCWPPVDDVTFLWTK